MIRLEYNKKYFKILKGFELNTSSRQVTFSDVVIDFTGYKMEDLPINFQEVHILKDNEIIYTGYINSFDLPKMKNQKQYIELSLNLLSPMQMTTNKIVTVIGTYQLRDIINKIFEPMIQDGFVIKEMNIRDGQKTVSFLLQTIEYVMNALSNSENIWWFINEKKEIFVNSLDYQFGLNPVMEITHDKKIEGLLSVIPTVEAVNYANVINVKNARVYFESSYFSYDSANNYKPLTLVKKLNNGDSIDFAYPVDISEDAIRRKIEYDKYGGSVQYSALSINTDYYNADIYIDRMTSSPNYDKYIISDNIGFCDEDGKMFTLKRDSFFPSLITGFTYRGDRELNVSIVLSLTALEYARMKLVDSNEIERNKGKISTSGIIEKTVDMNGRWFIDSELIDEVRSMMSINSNQTNIVKLELDKKHDCKIGDVIKINLPNFYTQGDFIITDISYSKSDVENWKITLRSSDVLENYIDLFREKPKQEIDEQNYRIMLAEYVEEKVFEVHEVVKNG